LATAVLVFAPTTPASAQTTDCLSLATTDQQIACLTNLIAELTAQVNALTVQQTASNAQVSKAWCHDFNTNLGWAQSGSAEVGYLHTALEKEGISYAPDTGNTYYTGTSNAVIVFQGYYGIYQGGYVGPQTRAQLNVLYGCTPATTPYVLITTPNGGETLVSGQTYNITWRQYGLGNINIAASDPVTGGKYYIATVPASNTGYAWTVGNYTWVLNAIANTPTLPLGNNWQIEIYTGTNPDNVAVPHDYSNSTFSIVAPTTTIQSSITSISPSSAPSGATVTVYGNNFAYTNTGAGTSVLLNGQHISPNYVNNTSLTFIVPANISAGTYNLSVSTSLTPSGTNSLPFTITSSNTTQPSITVTSPNGGQIWKIGETYNITWTSTNLLSSDAVAITLFANSVDPGSSIVASVAASSGSYSWAIPSNLVPGSTYKINVTKATAPTATDTSDNYFTISAAPIAGPSGLESIGLYDPTASSFYLRNTNTTGNADVVFGYGPDNGGWKPIAGDWNADSTDTVGLYDQSTSIFHLRNTNTSGSAEIAFGFGTAGANWKPIAGDWNGDGTDTVGLYDPVTSTFYLKNTNSAGYAEITFGFGTDNAGWLPIAGNWDGIGGDSVGLYDPATSIFYLRNTNTTGNADNTFGFGTAGTALKPLAGDWNNDGIDTTGLYNTATSMFYLRNANTIGVADLTFGYGGAGSGWLPISGDWNVVASNTCTTFDYSAWTPAICPASGTQTRTATGVPTGCTGTAPLPLTQTCTPPINPTITVTSPNGGETFPVGSSQVIPVSWITTNVVADNGINLVVLNNTGGVVVSSGILGGGTSYNWTPMLPVGQYKIKAQVCTIAGPIEATCGTVLAEDASNGYFGVANAGPVADLTVGFGASAADWLPVVGNWDGQGGTSVGVFDPPSNFYLKNSNTTGASDISFPYGQSAAGWLPIAGKWTNTATTSTIGLYDPINSWFYLRNSNSTGFADTTFSFGTAGWKPIAGDWDGNGTTTVGLYDPATSNFYLKNSNSTGYADISFGFGAPGWLPVAGDWDGDGDTTIGLYDPTTATFHLRNTNSVGYADASFVFGTANSGFKPVAGDWDGTGGDSVGLYDSISSVFYLKNFNTQSAMISKSDSLASISSAINNILAQLKVMLGQ